MAAIAAIALVILLIIKLVNGRKEYFDDYDDSNMLFQPDFDEVTVQDGGESEEETYPAEEPETKE